MKKLLLTTVLALATIVAMANPIGRTAAMQKAQDFMRGINPQAQLQAPATPRKAMGNLLSSVYKHASKTRVGNFLCEGPDSK